MRAARFPIACAIFGGGAFLSVLALGYFTPLSADQPFSWFNSQTNNSVGNFNLLFVFLGPILAIIGAYFMGAYLVARQKFERLMVTKSKAEFLRNLPEVEDLLWELTPTDEIRYARKKAELRIRR
jgi:hypothetical protein